MEQAIQNNIGAGELSGGLAIIAWTLLLKILTSPIYELSIKEPARSSKDRTEFFKEKIKDSGDYFDASTLKNWDI